MDRLNSWLTLGANIGILIGLLLVAAQINQQTEIAASERQAESFTWNIETNGLKATENLPERFARIMTNSDDITDADLVALDAYLTREFVMALRERSLASSGYVEDAASEISAMKWVFGNLGNESAMRWWRSNDFLLSLIPELRDQVDALLEEQGNSQTQLHKTLIEEMRSGPILLD
jgi:hypothetical protein